MGLDAELRALEDEIRMLDAKGMDTHHIKNLLKLATSFLRGGAPEKAQRYLDKAKQDLKELKAERAAKANDELIS